MIGAALGYELSGGWWRPSRRETPDPKSPALDLVFPNDALVPVRLAPDSVLKRITRFGELSDNLVATLPLAIFTKPGRKVQGLPNGEFMHSHFLLQHAEYRLIRRHSAPLNPTRFGG